MALVYKGAALEPWTSQHYSFVREKQERREQFSTGTNDTRFIVLLQSHVIQFQRVDIRFHSFMFIQQKKIEFICNTLMLDMQFSLYYIAIISNNIIMTLIQLQNWMGMEELMGINPGFIFNYCNKEISQLWRK